MNKFIGLLILISSMSISSNELIDTFNKLIFKDLDFNQKTMNLKTSTIDNSFGNIKRTNKVITINVESPFKERYKINEDYIEIYDYDFDETKTLLLEDIDIKTIEFLSKGINDKDVILFDNKSLIVKSIQDDIYFELINAESFIIKFKDNLGLENLINFQVSG
mgnify:FL=1